MLYDIIENIRKSFETLDNNVGKMALSWFPRLNKATILDLSNFELWEDRALILWEELGEDISAEGFFTFKKEIIPNYV
jgi:hypothetical protein